MASRPAHLDDSLTLRCGLGLLDRVAVAPLTNVQSNTDGTLHDRELTWLVRRARDGFRLVSTCAAYVSEEGKAWSGQLGISSDAHLPGLTRMATALHEAGARAIVQLHHAGKEAKEAGKKGLMLSTADAEGVQGASEADLARVRADFVAAAKRAEAAGFDGVEVHGANGYLFTQFLAPEDNPRTDAHGGSVENRSRFLREVVRAVRAAVAPGFAVGVRMNPVDLFADRGITLEDSCEVARGLGADGIDFLHLSQRDAGSEAVPAIRAALPSEVALFSVGNVWTRDDAERALLAGADVVVLGRAAMAHPDWVPASKAADFQPTKTPWSRAYLEARDLSGPFLEYISAFPGMVEGGAPARRSR